MFDWISEPFQYGFMQKAFLAVLFASINCALIGTYVVVRRMSFLADALTHTLLPGIVFAYLRGIHLFFGALFASLLTALSIGLLSSSKGVRQDSAIGVVLSFMFAMGILMMSLVHSFRDFSSILFGSVLGVSTGDLALIACVTLIVLIVLFLLHKEFELSSFDPIYSNLIRIGTHRLRYVLLILIALSVVSAVQMIGALLTTALLITPAAAAGLIAQKMTHMMLFSVFFAFISGILGLIASYHFQISSGAAIVINCSFCFIICWIVNFFLKRKN